MLAVAGSNTGAEVRAIATPSENRNDQLGAVIDIDRSDSSPSMGATSTNYRCSPLAHPRQPKDSAGSVRGDFAIQVNGAREDANNFLFDGVYNGDPKLNGVGVTPPVDAIREFEVLTHTYDASFGRNAGGQINVVLNSGTNTVHGTAWEFFRNAASNETNHFAPARGDASVPTESVRLLDRGTDRQGSNILLRRL